MLHSSINYLNFEFCRFALTKDLIWAYNKMWQKEFSLFFPMSLFLQHLF